MMNESHHDDDEIEMTNFDDEEYGELPNRDGDNGSGHDPRIGALPPRKKWTKTKCTIIFVAVALLAVAGYQFGGIYLMEETESLAVDETSGENEGIVSDAFDNAKTEEAFQNSNGGKGGGGKIAGGPGHHNNGNWLKNHLGNKGGTGTIDRDHLSNLGNHTFRHPGGPGGIGGNHLGGHGKGGIGGGNHGNIAHPGGQHQPGGHHQNGSAETDNDNSSNNSSSNNSAGNSSGSNNNGGSDGSSSSSNNNSNIADDDELFMLQLCDATPYADWHNKTVTMNDGPMFEIVEQFSHDKQAFTQGLTYANGVLYESTGLWRKSTVRILDPNTAEVQKKIPMEDQYFGEGMTYMTGNKLVQFTWKSKHGFIYNATTLDIIEEYEFTTTLDEGWGITWDACNNELIVTDGSEYLHFWDPDTMAQKRKIPVYRMNTGQPAKELNEIELWRGRVIANVWHEDVILVIDPVTGIIEKEYDFSTLWPAGERRSQGADVLNGVSISEDPDILYITGKKWNRMFKLRLQVPE